MHERDDDPARAAPPPEDADRLHKAALAALHDALAPKPELPPPPAGFDDRQLAGLNEVWRLLPGAPEKDIDLGTGWRRRLRDVAWRLLRPILERQQRFNMLLVQHLDSNAGGMIESRESVRAVIPLLDRHLGALAAFQSRLIHYLDHSVDALQRTRDALQQTRDQTRDADQGSDQVMPCSRPGMPRMPRSRRRKACASPSMPWSGPRRACANPSISPPHRPTG